MKKLLIPVIVGLIGASPVQAASVWLIMKEGIFIPGPAFSVDLEKLEMESMEQCEEQGAVFIASRRMGTGRDKFVGFECIEGK